MVEVHYRAVQVNPVTGVTEPHHTRAIHSDVESALGQIREDLSQGLDPICIVEHDADYSAEHWDGTPLGKRYEPKDWTSVLTRAELRRRAKGEK